ncbi:MAG: DUF885 domain-containing protein, partial [Burkholderiales bacterium]
MKRVGVLVAGFIALAVVPALAQNPDVEAQEVSRKLNRLFLDHAIASRPLFPLFATMNGWREYDGQFANDISEEHREAQHQFCRRGLENLKAFDRSRLDEHDQLSYDVYRYNQLRCLDGLGFDLHLLPIDQGGVNLIATFPIWGSGKGPQPFRNAGDYENFLKRITGFVGWMDTTIANMRRGIARGFVQPREVMEKTLPQLSAMILDDVKQSPFYEPIADMPEEIEGEDRRRLSAAYEDAIRNQIVPAYRRVRDFVRDEYLPKCRATAGLTGLPGGDRLYAHYIRVQTTSSLTPQEIFDLGHREVARLRERMEALKKASVFDGDLKD